MNKTVSDVLGEHGWTGASLSLSQVPCPGSPVKPGLAKLPAGHPAVLCPRLSEILFSDLQLQSVFS